MQALYLAFFVLHVAASALGLAAMFPSLLAQKGGGVHARAGWLFSFGMLVSGLTGTVLAGAWVAAPAQFRPSETLEAARVHGVFLALIGTITVSAVIQAHRALERKRVPGPQINRRHLASSSVLMVMSIAALVVGGRAGHALSLVFGVLGLALVARDIVFALKPLPHEGAHLYHHIQSMGTACIAAVTAFVVLGGGRLLDVARVGGPAWLLWVLPGVVLGSVFGYWTRRYRRKFASRAAHVAAPRPMTKSEAAQ